MLQTVLLAACGIIVQGVLCRAGLVRKAAVLPGSQDPHISSSSEIVASPKGSSIM